MRYTNVLFVAAALLLHVFCIFAVAAPRRSVHDWSHGCLMNKRAELARATTKQFVHINLDQCILYLYTMQKKHIYIWGGMSTKSKVFLSAEKTNYKKERPRIEIYWTRKRHIVINVKMFVYLSVFFIDAVLIISSRW